MNQGNLPVARMKSAITRQVNVAKPKMAKIPHDGDGMDAPKPKLRKAKKGIRFMGSFKFGGPVRHTGVYLLHKGESVKSPFNRRRG